MENTNYVIKIDGEAICLNGETTATEESTQAILQQPSPNSDSQNPKPQPTDSSTPTEQINQEVIEQDVNLEEESGNVIDPTDVQNVVNCFKWKLIDEGMFYWDVQVDSEGRMSNFFFRDGRSRIDYNCFSDVVIFDTSYRSNKYNLICAPFIGVNHHWQNIIFGCAFLLDDSAESYEWLFKSFVDSMGGYAPRSIFTDLNPSVLNAVESVLPNTRHCLAPWHVQKIIDSHIGTLNASETFQNLFAKCLRECETEMEFEKTWEEIFCKFNLQEHDWLTDLYELRHKWSSILHKDAFDAGITSVEKIETLTNVLTNISDKGTSLLDLVSSIDKLTASWRATESEEDVQCSQSGPARAIPRSTLLKHAAEVYTHKAYKIIEADFLDQSCPTSYEETRYRDSVYRFKFMNHGKKVWMASLDMDTMTLTCSCMKFETMGLLCPHTLNALALKCIDRIPDKYILLRWTKDARSSINGIGREDCTHQTTNMPTNQIYIRPNMQPLCASQESSAYGLSIHPATLTFESQKKRPKVINYFF